MRFYLSMNISPTAVRQYIFPILGKKDFVTTFLFFKILVFVLFFNTNVIQVNPSILDRTNGSDFESGIIDYKDDCTMIPKIRITSYKRENYKPNKPGDTELKFNTTGDVLNYIQAPFVSLVEIECISSSPIEWTFDGVINPPVKQIEIIRSPVVKTSSKYCFIVTMLLETSKKATGRYWCRTMDKMGHSKLYVYADANGPPLLLNDGLKINIVSSKNSTVVLPCEVANRSVPPHLFKGNINITMLDSVSYDPEVGFNLDLRKISNPYDTYECRVTDDSVTISINKPPDFEVSPSRKNVIVVQNHSVKLTCRSKNLIGLHGFINESRVKFSEATPDSEYKYSVSYDFLGTETTEVSCVDLSTNINVTLHTWKCIVISTEAEVSQGIFYDSSKNRFVCRSKTSEEPAIALAECTNPIDCKFKDKCYTWDAPYTIKGVRDGNCKPTFNRGISCTSKDRIELNSNLTACSYVLNTFETGAVYCSVNGEKVQTMNFFNGIDEQKKAVITNWSEVSANQLIQVVTENRTFYAGEYIKFDCKATKFLFAHGFKWMFRMHDGSYVNPKIHSDDNDDNFHIGNVQKISYILESVNLEIDNIDIKAVVCFVSLWNYTEWLNVSYPILVKPGNRPIILNPDEVLDFTAGTNQSVICKANGVPTPTIRWFRNGEPVKHQQIFTDAINSSIWKPGFTDNLLHLGIVDQDDEAEYICEARNVIGVASKKFRATVTQPTNTKGTFLLIMGLVFFTCFLSIIVVLWNRLRKGQKTIELLNRDVLKFRYGDEKALLGAAHGYIRGDYLPYNPQYEISGDNLEIDPKKILGEGEYGVVLKGILKGPNNHEDEVAVKTPRGSDLSHYKALLSELKILTHIGWHDHVINLLGAVTRNLKYHEVYVVVEYCHLGNLNDFLRNNKTFYLHQIQDDIIDLNITFNTSLVSCSGYVANTYNLSTANLLNWSHQVTLGMEYLANKRVIHGDLSTRNILLTENRTAKITDFGLSIHLYSGPNDSITQTPDALVPWKWSAPEVLQYNNFSSQSDVWAFGVTLWEMFSLGDAPYPGHVYSTNFKNSLLEGYRMEKPIFANNQIYNIILQCWHSTPNNRITFIELRKFFDRILNNSIDPPIVPTPTIAAENVVYLDPETLDHFTSEE